jgi:hypothetical protein
MEKNSNPILREKMLREYALHLLSAGYRGIEQYITSSVAGDSETECQLITGSVVKYDVFASTEAEKLIFSNTKWFLLGMGKTYTCGGKKVKYPETGWFYVLR